MEKAPPPPPTPFEMILSTKVQCEGDPLCLKSYDTYVEIEREVAKQWPKSSIRRVEAGHVLFLDTQQLVVDTVKRVASK